MAPPLTSPLPSPLPSPTSQDLLLGRLAQPGPDPGLHTLTDDVPGRAQAATICLPGHVPRATSPGNGSSSSGRSGASLLELAVGPVVAAAAHVPSRPLGRSLPVSVVSGGAIRGALVVLDDGVSCVSLSEAVMLSRAMRYSPLGTGSVLRVP